MIGLFAAVVGAAALVGAVGTRIARDLAIRYGHLDQPEARKVHTAAVPRVGGAGIVAGATAGLVVLIVGANDVGLDLPHLDLAAVLLGALAVFVTGFWDDLYGLGFKRRFVIQAGVAWAMTLAGWHVDLSQVPFVEHLGPFEQAAISVPLTVLWTVGLINAMNLLDGLDGLAGGTAVIGFTALALAFLPTGDAALFVLCALGVGGTLGFLVYNRAPATVFMGDGGSTFLGFLLAMAGISGVDAVPSGGLVILPAVALGLPLLDTLTQMVRRYLAGLSPFEPDRDHLHHRAFDRSGGVRSAVAKLHATAATFGALAVTLRLAAGSPLLQGGVLLVAAGVAWAVVRRLGYVRARDVARVVGDRLGILRPYSPPTVVIHETRSLEPRSEETAAESDA